jgi:hypothetical protein
MIAKSDRTQLEVEFLRICRARRPEWIASIIRPLRLKNDFVTVQDIPATALWQIVHLFGKVQNPMFGVPVR